MNDIVWREMPEKNPAHRRFLATMPGPWPGHVLEQTRLVNMRMAEQFMLGANEYIALEKALVERNLRAYAVQIAGDMEARRAHRHALRGTRGTL